MFSGYQGELYYNTIMYCRYLKLYNDCKWYQIFLKKELKDAMSFHYPMMLNEIK